MGAKIGSVGMIMWQSLKVAWWAIILVVCVIVAIVTIKGKGQAVDRKSNSDHVTMARSKIEKAVFGLKIDRAVLQAQTDAQRAIVEDIRQDPDEANKRRRLAEFLQQNL